MPFRDYLQQKLSEAGMRPAELARRSGLTPQNISRILTDKPHPISGAPPKVTERTAEAIAKALNLDVNEVRLQAGFAPDAMADIEVADDLRIALLDKSLSDDDREEIMRELGFAYEILKARIASRKTHK